MRVDMRKLSLALLLAMPSAVHAQLWIGPAALEVQADDPKGHALAGAHVLLQYKSLTPKDGPQSVETDSRGRANVSGLAEGAWHLEVSHDGFMTYMAEIEVRQKGRPELVDATQFRVPGGGTSLMRVRISRGTPGPAPIRSTVPIPPAQPMVPREPPAPAPAAQPAPAPVAPVTPPPAQPEPQAQPAPEPPRPQSPAPAPQPQETPMPTEPRPQPHPMPRLPPAVPAPRPTPEPPPVEPVHPTPGVETPEPAPAPAAPPVDAVRIRTAKDRTCVECQPGETALSIEWVIPTAGGSGCGPDLAAKLKGGTVPSGLPEGCHVLRAELPAGARFTAFRYEVQDGRDSFDCATGKDCPGNVGRWPDNPTLVRRPQGTLVLAPFESGSGGAGRRAVLTVYYTAGRQ